MHSVYLNNYNACDFNLQIHSAAIASMVYEKQHGLVFTGSKDRTIKVWTAGKNFTQVSVGSE